ncbi:hypothetical protein BGZ96_004583, partial [Linnemannia gamsii]
EPKPKSWKAIAERKRPLSMVEQPVKVRRMESTSDDDYELTQDPGHSKYRSHHTHSEDAATGRVQATGLHPPPPMAKANLQAKDDTLFSLMGKVKDFFASDCQVMLILGDSGAGKSTFHRHLEYELWLGYKAGERIPLFINLPALKKPEPAAPKGTRTFIARKSDKDSCQQ